MRLYFTKDYAELLKTPEGEVVGANSGRLPTFYAGAIEHQQIGYHVVVLHADVLHYDYRVIKVYPDYEAAVFDVILDPDASFTAYYVSGGAALPPSEWLLASQNFFETIGGVSRNTLPIPGEIRSWDDVRDACAARIAGVSSDCFSVHDSFSTTLLDAAVSYSFADDVYYFAYPPSAGYFTTGFHVEASNHDLSLTLVVDY